MSNLQRQTRNTPKVISRKRPLATRHWFAPGNGVPMCFMISAFCLAALVFTRRRSRATLTLLLVMLLISAGGIVATWQLERGSEGSALAVVTGKDVQARLATADTANSVLALPPGSEVKILSTRGDWIYAALPNNLRGWIPAKNAGRV